MKGKIAWFVPYPLQGSGGHRTIFSHIRNLADRGHQCHVFIGEESAQDMSVEALRELVENWFGPCPARIHSGYGTDDGFDLAVATAWWTAEVVAREVDAEHKLYFVQDYEPYFNPMGDNYILAENSYRLGLAPLTIGRWLSHLLQERFDSCGNFFEFSADSSKYFPFDSVDKEQAVCFVYQPEKPRRCAAIGRDALAIVKHQLPEVKIYTYGTSDEPGFPFEHEHLGILSLEECNRLYNRCTVGLCLSSSNPSRVPFEMMAAGLPAVDFYRDNTIYDMPDDGVLLAEQNGSSLAGAMIKILQSPELQKKMCRDGHLFMEKRDAGLEFEQCATIMEDIMDGQGSAKKNITPLYRSAPYAADYPTPQELPTVKQLVEEVQESYPSLFERIRNIRNNRIGRILKVLWKGYY